MIVPDINLLLYAVIDTFPAHEQAKTWWEGLLGGSAYVGLPSVVVFGFIRIATNPRIFDTPMSGTEATTRVDRWLQQPRVHHVHGGQRHLQIAFDLIERLGTAANLTTDIQIAAIAIETQAEVHSNDGDFGRFPGLRWTNPLSSAHASSG